MKHGGDGYFGQQPYPLLYEGLRHFDSPLLREMILAEANYCLEGLYGGKTGIVCALAYEMTGDPIYAAWCKKEVFDYRKFALDIVELRSDSIFSGLRNGHISVLRGPAARAWDRDPKALEEAETRLKSLKKERPTPPGPPGSREVNLGVPEGYAE